MLNDIMIITSTAVVLCTLVFILFRYYKRITKDNSIVDKIFIIFVIFILIIPITKINKVEFSTNENRKLAEKPSLVEKQVINLAYGKNFEIWLNDRFRYRNKIIYWHDKVEAVLAGRLENEKAFQGKDNWLFYKGEGSVSLYQHKAVFTDDEMQTIQKNLEKRKSWLNEQGIEFFVVVPPDKSSVYGEYYREGIIPVGNKNRMQILEEYLVANKSEMKMNYLLDIMLEHKDNGLLYYKTDTHWGEYGAYLGYLALMKDIKTKFPQMQDLPIDAVNLNYTTHSEGDLTTMLGIKDVSIYNDNYLIPMPKEGYHFTYVKNEGRDGIITHNPDKSLKVLVFRDSFSTALVPYLSETFGDVEYIWSHDFNSYQDKIMQEKPDIVIHEIVSRYVNCLLQDTPELKEVRE